MNPKQFTIILLFISSLTIAQKKDSVISEMQAIAIGEKDSGYLGTWVKTELKNNQWHVTSNSKSAHPPMYYIIDAKTGKILLKLDNSDDPVQKEKLKKFLAQNKKSK